ncbi:MAG: single-stranded DNA-binding protein [Candidatus Methanomethylophilus sp.]|jgi:replication factor A1|nr:single-stranded DNA-binding protein [Methanomethylophilus sp.]MCI2074912.1 single-stranded DNA-binding protein [Methanomethylophilus sp.]MCI2093600.1 single-stranded DNA-binding protein [Methanomethylophilus sp.]
MEDSGKIDIGPIAEEIFGALGGKVDMETIRKEADTYINVYHIEPETAKSGIMKKLGGRKPSDGVQVSSSGVTKKVGEITGTEMNVTVTAKILFVEKREITARGVPKTIISGICADDTGSIPFTIWSDEGEYEKGSVYTFKNAYTKKFRDAPQLNIGNRGKVIPAPDVSFESISQSSEAVSPQAKPVKISEITDKSGNVCITGKIIDVATREISIKGEPKTVWSGTIADDTGKITFTAWNDFKLREGENVKIANAYIRAWKGIPQLNIDKTTVEEISGEIPGVKAEDSQKTVGEIVRIGGGLDIVIKGTVVDIRSGSGLIDRCPQCRRAISNGECAVHGPVQNPVKDLRIKATVDDGTGAISAIIGRADTEKLTGMTLDEAEALAESSGNPGAVADRIASALVLKRVTLKGNAMTDDFGPSIIVHSAQLSPVDVKAEARKLYEEVEGSL